MKYGRNGAWAAIAALGVGLLVCGCVCTQANARVRVNDAGRVAKRYGSVIGLRPEKLEEYEQLHAAVWPEVLKMIHECNIRNYSIYLFHAKDNEYYLFSYFEYTGHDFKADMDKMAADPTTQKWWAVCKPCQDPVPLRAADEWWANLEEVFHCD